jgi:NAD(P)-dependent dehydrogenase (short-subunit alcohol dehydrogenase family)
MSQRLQNRVVLVTGVGQGIGAAIARRFVNEGANVIGIDRNTATLEQLAVELPAFTPFTVDVQDHDALTDCVNQTIDGHGKIDILINNAGFQHTIPFMEGTLEQWRETQRVNLEAQYVLCRLVVPHMIDVGYGRIVNISSTQAISVEPSVSAYAASKGGVNALTRSLAVELAPHGINVNAIAPGCIHTSMSIINGVDETTTDEFQEWYVRRRKIPLGRPGEAQEIAAAALFLASEECSYITGHTLVADGGLTITF